MDTSWIHLIIDKISGGHFDFAAQEFGQQRVSKTGQAVVLALVVGNPDAEQANEIVEGFQDALARQDHFRRLECVCLDRWICRAGRVGGEVVHEGMRRHPLV